MRVISGMLAWQSEREGEDVLASGGRVPVPLRGFKGTDYPASEAIRLQVKVACLRCVLGAGVTNGQWSNC